MISHLLSIFPLNEERGFARLTVLAASAPDHDALRTGLVLMKRELIKLLADPELSDHTFQILRCLDHGEAVQMPISTSVVEALDHANRSLPRHPQMDRQSARAQMFVVPS